MTRILIIGGGAIGQVYGYFLQRGGAEITFLLKQEYVQDARDNGFVLYNVNKSEERTEFREFKCCSDIEELTAATRGAGEEEAADEDSISSSCSCFDQIWITVASDSLHQGDWLEHLLNEKRAAYLDKNHPTSVIYLQPDLVDRQRIEAAVVAGSSSVALVQGVIQFLAYQSPLPEETDLLKLEQRGVTYYMGPAPRLLPTSLFAPANDSTKLIRRLFKKGCGIRVGLRNEEAAAFYYARVAAMSVAVMASLETAVDWSLSDFRAPAVQRATRRAVREAMHVTLAYNQATYWSVFYEPIIFCFVKTVAYAAAFLPIPLERYLKFHFTKVGKQTRHMLKTYCEQGDRLGIECDTLASLLTKLSETPED